LGGDRQVLRSDYKQEVNRSSTRYAAPVGKAISQMLTTPTDAVSIDLSNGFRDRIL